MTKNIAVNTRVLQKPNMGVRRYVEELMLAFGGEVYSVQPKFPLWGLRAHLWEQLILPFRVFNKLLWSPIGLGPLLCRNQVVTLHDVSFLDHPEWYGKNYAKWYGFVTPLLLRRSLHVITISNFAKESIIHQTGIESSKISVIYNGVNTDDFYPRSEQEIESTIHTLNIPSNKYILFFGTLEPRKNLVRLIDAWRMVHKDFEQDNIWFVIAGAKGKSSVFQGVDFSDLPPRVFFTGYVADELLPSLYSGAITLAYVSLYEGFGLPPLESMACGTPPLTGNLTAIPEVVGEGGLMVDPYNTSAIASGLKKMVQDKEFRDRLRVAGIKRASEFSWEKCAKETFLVLRKIASSG